MIPHVVLYKSNPKNRRAAQRIVRKARRCLRGIECIRLLYAGEVDDLGRSVSGKGYDVMLITFFRTAADRRHYMKDPRHMEFVRFVLKGYQLKGTKAKNPEEEFYEFILRGKGKRKWERNPCIPEDQVVWGGEAVFDGKKYVLAG